MLIFLFIFSSPASVHSIGCDSLTKKSITTYVPSDSTVDWKNGNSYSASYEIKKLAGWYQIDNAQWIWNISNAEYLAPGGQILEFNKTFSVIGNITSGRLKISVDDSISECKINERSIILPLGVSYKSLVTVDITTSLNSGKNYFKVTAVNGANSANPAGLTFMIEIDSDVFA